MLINVSSLAEGDTIPVCFKRQRIDIHSGREVTAVTDLEGSLTYRGNGAYVLSGKVDAVLSLNCDLCLKPFQSELTFTVDEVFCNDTDSQKEYWSFSDKTIDLKPAVTADILLNMPMRAVCSEDCRGLCPKCGHNLNEGDCGCGRVYRNPQFEKLMTLFKDDKEV